MSIKAPALVRFFMNWSTLRPYFPFLGVWYLPIVKLALSVIVCHLHRPSLLLNFGLRPRYRHILSIIFRNWRSLPVGYESLCFQLSWLINLWCLVHIELLLPYYIFSLHSVTEILFSTNSGTNLSLINWICFN